MTEETAIATLRILNESALRSFALKCSNEIRAGKFDRVGADFIEMVQADLESTIRRLRFEHPLAETPVDQETLRFVTGALLEKLEPILNEMVARIIQRRVRRHPSLGKTLKA